MDTPLQLGPMGHTTVTLDSLPVQLSDGATINLAIVKSDPHSVLLLVSQIDARRIFGPVGDITELLEKAAAVRKAPHAAGVTAEQRLLVAPRALLEYLLAEKGAFEGVTNVTVIIGDHCCSSNASLGFHVISCMASAPAA